MRTESAKRRTPCLSIKEYILMWLSNPILVNWYIYIQSSGQARTELLQQGYSNTISILQNQHANQNALKSFDLDRLFDQLVSGVSSNLPQNTKASKHHISKKYGGADFIGRPVLYVLKELNKIISEHIADIEIANDCVDSSGPRTVIILNNEWKWSIRKGNCLRLNNILKTTATEYKWWPIDKLAISSGLNWILNRREESANIHSLCISGCDPAISHVLRRKQY